MKLAWSAATDDKGVKNYDVLRDGAKVATVTTTSYTDTGLTMRQRLLLHGPSP